MPGPQLLGGLGHEADRANGDLPPGQLPPAQPAGATSPTVTGSTSSLDYSLLAVSGPVMRRSSGNVAAMTPSASPIPAAVMT